MKEKINVLVLPSDKTGVGKFRSVDPHVFLQNLYPDDFHVDIDYEPQINNIEYWKKYLKFNFKQEKIEPAIKSDLRYYKNLVSYKYLKDNIEDIKNKYVNLLLMDTLSYFPKEEDNEIVDVENLEVDSVPKKKLSLNRLNNLYKHHFQFNKQTK